MSSDSGTIELTTTNSEEVTIPETDSEDLKNPFENYYRSITELWTPTNWQQMHLMQPLTPLLQTTQGNFTIGPSRQSSSALTLSTYRRTTMSPTQLKPMTVGRLFDLLNYAMIEGLEPDTEVAISITNSTIMTAYSVQTGDITLHIDADSEIDAETCVLSAIPL